jgi:hypothetical protein
MHFHKRPVPMDEIIEKINQVSIESVQNACEKAISGVPTLAVVGVIDKVMPYEDFINNFK